MPGTVTLSVEVELGWGQHDLPEFDHLSSGRTAESAALSRLLEICDRLDLPISFDVVGHLFERSCRGSHDGPYPAEWWAADPGSDEDQDPLFYAPDLVAEIQQAAVDHEICTHTYSHVLADEIPPETLAHELRVVQSLHEAWGLSRAESIVLPRHRDAPADVLRDAGIRTIRRPFPRYRDGHGSRLETLRWHLSREHPIEALRTADDLVETWCTPHPSLTSVFLPAGQTGPHPIYRAIPRRIRQRRHGRYLRSAVDRLVHTGKHLHLWTHLYNLTGEGQWDPVQGGLEYLAQCRDRGQLSVEPMRALPSRVVD